MKTGRTRLLAAALALSSAAFAPALTGAATPLDGAPAVASDEAPDDAGSGRDAGDELATAVRIDANVAYDASFDGHTEEGGESRAYGDWVDLYLIDLQAGDVVDLGFVASVQQLGCMQISRAEDDPLTDCSGAGLVAETSGTYKLRISNTFQTPQTYRFSVGVNQTAPGLLGPASPAPAATVADLDEPHAQVVVGVQDSGVNPYHEVYHRPERTQHPCTYVIGYDDCSVEALELTLGEHANWRDAYEADREVWASMQLNTWYWIPGTNLVAVSCATLRTTSTGSVPAITDIPDTCVFDEFAHGTGTTSSVLSEAPDALLVAVEGQANTELLRTTPVALDVQSHSWGVIVANPVLAIDGEAAPLFFQASGNDPAPSVIDGSSLPPSTIVVGGGYPGMTETMARSMPDFASWYCRPTADNTTTKGLRPYCGTSFAAPTAAGAAAAALLEVRRAQGWTEHRMVGDLVADGITRDAFLDAVRLGATYTPTDAVRFATPPFATARPLLDGEAPIAYGYGWLDASRVEAIVDCALGGPCRTLDDNAATWNDARRQYRETVAGEGG